MAGGRADNIEMTLLLVIIMIACLVHQGVSRGNSLSFLSSPGFVRVVGYEGSYNLNLDIEVLSFCYNINITTTCSQDKNLAGRRTSDISQV